MASQTTPSRSRRISEAVEEHDASAAGGVLLARDVYSQQMAGVTTLAGGPSASYEASLGRSLNAAAASLTANDPSLSISTFADNAARARADRVGFAVGNATLESRLADCKPFEPKLLSGQEIGRKQREGSVSLRGPDDSPSLKTTAMAPRPVLAYQLEKQPHAPTMAAPRGQTHVQSTFSLDEMGSRGVTTHGTPLKCRGSQTTEEARAFAEAAEAAAAAQRVAPLKKQEMLTAQWSLQ